MKYISRMVVTDLRRGSERVECYGPFSAPASARDFGWEKMRETERKLAKTRSCASDATPDEDLYLGYTQYLYSDADRTVYKVRVRTEVLNEMKCDIIKSSVPAQPEMI